MMGFTLISVVWLLFGGVKTQGMYYFLCCWFGFGTGYWAMFVTIGAEQFGTNIRATAATTIPNMVRGALILLTLGFDTFKYLGTIQSAALIGLISFVVGIYCTASIGETHGRDLNFIEE